ncbi:MAG: FABP family protein [Actinobacteria bacterium]|nr:FABP family protein [Actinomycetota bacterium]
MKLDLSFLIGTWRGQGEGGFPSVEDFRYREQMTFTDAGDGVLVYREEAWDDDGEPVHSEAGYLRALDDGSIDFALAYPFGVSEVMEGVVEGTKLTLASSSVGVATHGEPVTGLTRVIQAEQDALKYETLMATPDQTMTRHLRGTLTRS